MHAETRDLALLATVSFFCTGAALIADHIIFGAVFFVLGAVALFGAAERHWR
jgi:hypothetical protein